MEDIVWSPKADTYIFLCKYSALQELTSLWNAVLKTIDPIPFQNYKEGCNVSRCSMREEGMCFLPSPARGCTDQQDLGEAASQRGIVTPGSCPPVLYLWARLPLNLRPFWTGHHASHLLKVTLVAGPYSVVTWHTYFPLCICRQQNRPVLNDFQKCKFCSLCQSYQLEQSVLEH